MNKCSNEIILKQENKSENKISFFQPRILFGLFCGNFSKDGREKEKDDLAHECFMRYNAMEMEK
jgi:hypothetical protein